MQKAWETRSYVVCGMVFMCIHIEIKKMPEIEVIIHQTTKASMMIVKHTGTIMSETKKNNKKSNVFAPVFGRK